MTSAVLTSPSFATTHWSVVMLAGEGVSPQSSAALERLCRTYWYPLYSFIRRKGYREQDAEDLTQQFFTTLLERRDFDRVAPHKGKFRTFLLTSLTHFLSNERDRAQAVKRGSGQALISLDELRANPGYRDEPACDLAPDKLFDLRWATTVLKQALEQLRADSTRAGKGEQFDQLKKYLTDEPAAGEYAALAASLGMTSQSLAVAVHRLRVRYREFVRAEVLQTVSSPLELEEELRHLYAVLNQ
jgi:DNA-directed RNA polymerase specialized sigma24 family protein